MTLRTCSRYLKGLPNLAFCVSKKIVTARRTNQILCQEKWKKLRFWKNEAQNRVGIFWQNPIFWAETFFQRPLENFLLAWRTCSRYLKGPPNLVLCVSKKIVTIRHTNKKILAKNRQKKIFVSTVFLFFHVLHYVLHLEYVMALRMEYVMIVESQNSWSMQEIHQNFLMASNVSFGFIWVHFLSYFHLVPLLTTSTTSQIKPYFELQIGISGKAFFWVVKENNEYWTHKSKLIICFRKLLFPCACIIW